MHSVHISVSKIAPVVLESKTVQKLKQEEIIRRKVRWGEPEKYIQSLCYIL